MVRIKDAEVLGFLSARRHWTVRNPNTFMVEINIARSLMAGRFLGTSAGK